MPSRLVSSGLVSLVISVGCFSPEEEDDITGSDTDVGSSSGTVSSTEPTVGSQSASETESTTATTATTSPSTTEPTATATESESDTDPDTSTGDTPPACGDGEATPGEFCPVEEPESLPAGGGTVEVVVADLGGDAALDVAALSRVDEAVFVWRNDGNGGLGAVGPQAVSANSCGLAAADGEGDGDVDLVVLGESLVSLVNDGADGFVRNDSDPDGFGGCGDHNDLGVLNNNGGPLDVVHSGAYNNTYSPGTNPPAGWSFGMGVGIGGVTEGSSGVTVTEWAFDDDNTHDVIVLNQYFTTAELFGGDGMGGFVALGEIDACLGLNGAGGARYAATGDVDDDGDIDLIVTCMEGNFVLIRGTATAAFEAPIEVLLAGAHQPLIADLDGDDDLDILISSTSGQAVNVYLNDGGMPAAPIELAVPGEARGLAVGDLEGDGAPEILAAVTAEMSSGVAVFRMDP